MFIKINEETINTDHIVWAQEGSHQNHNVTTIHLSNGKILELPFVDTRTLWKAVGREDIDELRKS